MLLTEYDEQAHIESEKEIAREEGWEEGRTKGKEEGEREGKKEGARRINTLNQRLIQDGRQEDLVKAVGDAEYQNRLLKEYGL